VSGLAFEWDPRKAAANRRKHGVSFEEAATIFDDPVVLLLAELEHGEPRIVAIGASDKIESATSSTGPSRSSCWSD
jgi:uncharacterized DUF497 family protein